MWQLLKTELKYNTLIISVAYVLMLANIFFLIQVNRYDLKEVDMNSFFITMIGLVGVIIVAKIWVLRSKENRDRIHTVLPLTPFMISSAKILSVVIPWCFELIILLIAYFIIPDVWNDFGAPIIRMSLVTMVYTSAALLIFEFISSKNNNAKFTQVYLLGGLVVIGASLPFFYFVLDLHPILANVFSVILSSVFLGWAAVKFSKSSNYLR